MHHTIGNNNIHHHDPFPLTRAVSSSLHLIHLFVRGSAMSTTAQPETILAFLINLSAWLFRDRPSHHQRRLHALQIYPTPLLKAIVHAQHIVADTHMTLETFRTLGMPDVIHDTVEAYALQADENARERRDRLATNPYIVEITILQLTHAMANPQILPAEQRTLEHEQLFWINKRHARDEQTCCRPSSCHA